MSAQYFYSLLFRGITVVDCLKDTILVQLGLLNLFKSVAANSKLVEVNGAKRKMKDFLKV
jgi:hypothetical protein